VKYEKANCQLKTIETENKTISDFVVLSNS